jgi:hypothetical protein
MDIELIMAEDNENQFLKNEFSINVKEYLVLDEQISRLNKALKERRTKLKELSASIMMAMTKNDIEHINIKNGVLVHNTKESFKSLNKMNLKNGLTLYFKDDAIKADDATETVMNNREKVIKETLKLKRF